MKCNKNKCRLIRFCVYVEKTPEIINCVSQFSSVDICVHVYQFSSVQLFSCVQLFSTPWTAARHTSLSPTPRAYQNSCPLTQLCHPTILSSIIPFPCFQSFPASGSFQMSQFFASGGQSIGVSASAPVLPMNIQD